MSRRPNLEPSARINLAIPMSKKAWLDMYLFDVSQRRVPVGAYQKLFLHFLDELQHRTQVTHGHKGLKRNHGTAQQSA